MSADADSPTDAQDGVIKFAFRQRSGVDAPGLPDEVTVVVDETVAGYLGWTVDAALERISLAPAFEDVDAEALKVALGETHYAEYAFLEQHAYGQPAGVTTTNAFRTNRPVDHENIPFAAGDTFETADGTTLTYEDYPTGGLQFETGDGSVSQFGAHKLPETVAIEPEVA